MRFNQVIGTGGIGTGILFELDNDRTLSRNETRLGALSPTRDYCKQHIILHYIAKALAPGVQVRPIGLVGDDDAGRGLVRQMQDAGMDTALVGLSSEKPTMYCVCIQYPDKAVCNVTTSESACSLVDRACMRAALAQLSMDKRTLVVAAPEVPVEARLELLAQARASGAYCVSSCLVDEFPEFIAGGGLKMTDLLVINEDEGAAMCGAEEADLEKLAALCHELHRKANPRARTAMTCGAAGSYVCEGGEVHAVPACKAQVVATGGAGDAYTAGTICGLTLGLPFLPGEGYCAPQLGARLAAEAIGVADTIAGHIGREMIMSFLKEGNGEKLC